MDKMLLHSLCPDENELALFIDGKLIGDRLRSIKLHLDTCRICNDMVKLAFELHGIDIKEENNSLEASSFQKYAALNKWNLCVLHAEMYILQLYEMRFDILTLMELAHKHGWLSSGGVQFRDIGKLLEFFGFNIERKSDCVPEDIQDALAQGYSIIVGVDEGELFPRSKFDKIIEIIDDWFNKRPDHALIVTGIQISDDMEKTVRVINFENDKPVNYTIPFAKFIDAWDDSENYMVVVRKLSK